ncbi:MAG: TGS domain-containing protein [Candidatus Aenigmarchaeota archaeon]|nr:TGS domain-containing protein [Candidatus Aenigmarchaeota archaeon]
MPINATPEYYKAEERYRNAKSTEEKIALLEEMIRLAPKHKGGEHLLASLRGKLAKLKKENISKKTGKSYGITKEGDCQVCIIGMPNSGKSTMLKKLTSAKPAISSYPFTTKKPEIGMIDYNGIKLQLVEIPSTFEVRFLSICRTADIVILLARNESEKKELQELLDKWSIRTKQLVIRQDYNEAKIKSDIWKMSGLMSVYTKNTPMALPANSTIKDFAHRIHKDFIKNFRFARVKRRIKGKERIMQVGLDYVLEDGDVVEVVC